MTDKLVNNLKNLIIIYKKYFLYGLNITNHFLPNFQSYLYNFSYYNI